MAELKIAWVMFYAFAPPIYIYAIVTNFETSRSIVLFILASLTGIIALGRLGIKFFKELIDVWILYRHENIDIKGLKQSVIIIALLVVVILLIAVILFLIFK